MIILKCLMVLSTFHDPGWRPYILMTEMRLVIVPYGILINILTMVMDYFAHKPVIHETALTIIL